MAFIKFRVQSSKLKDCSTFAAEMGILYVVPTPVGNMEDMTLRAIRVLKEADVVLAEDTRTSGILLNHFGIKQHLLSHHKFNEHGTSASVVERLQAGQTVALISDAGTPGISDPGFFLVREAVRAGIERTMVFYESPYRVLKTLQQFAEVFGAERQVSVCREISKVHEESVRGTLAEAIAHFTEHEPRGEFVIVLAGKEK